MLNWRQKQVVINNLLINYYQNLEDSNKPVLLFLHGWRSEGLVWKQIVEKMPACYNIYVLDLSGFGKSQTPPPDFTLQDYANIINSFIKKFSLSSVVIVGHSFGGRVTIKLAAQKPGYLNKIVLVDSAGVRQVSLTRSLTVVVAKIIKPLFKLSFLKNLRRRIYKNLGAQDYLATPKLQSILLNIINEDLTPLLSKISLPTLLIWGANDQETPVAQARVMEQLVPGSKLIILSHAGHFSFLDQPDIFVQELKKFLN